VYDVACGHWVAMHKEDTTVQQCPKKSGRRVASIPLERSFAHTISHALAAIEHIANLRAPADPASFHLWYTYVSGRDGGLRRAIDKLLCEGPAISIADLDRLYDRYLSPAIAQQVEKVGAELEEQASRLAVELDHALNYSSKYEAELRDSNKHLPDVNDPEVLRTMVDKLLHATREMYQNTQSIQRFVNSYKAEVAVLQEKLAAICQESLTDPITSLANRRRFDHEIELAVASVAQTGRPLSLLMCDIDHFKSFNDAFGHVVGDEVLRLVGWSIRQTIRGRDIAARYGGDEFAVILPDSDLHQAGIVAENIRRGIGGKKVVKRSTQQVLGQISVSIGTAQLCPGEGSEQLIERADGQLYVAKGAGRNRVA
jgi:diguanylate cyclase